MHELSIASAIVDAARAEARSHPGARLQTLGLLVGALSGVNPEALRFCFDSLTKETELEGLRLEIQECPQRNLCPQCPLTFDVIEYQAACPECGTRQTECVSGHELELAYLEVEEP